ncbi:NifB/NifX family molybdenum-iron cluster-binding protein [Elusimicrobiota bacterium]
MTKIALPLVEGKFSMHFGHCEEFAVFDVEGKEIKSKINITPPPHEPGVLPEFMHQQGVDCIIASGMGMRAQQLFEQKGIKVIVGAIGKDPEKIVNEYINDSLETGENACDH